MKMVLLIVCGWCCAFNGQGQVVISSRLVKLAWDAPSDGIPPEFYVVGITDARDSITNDSLISLTPRPTNILGLWISKTNITDIWSYFPASVGKRRSLSIWVASCASGLLSDWVKLDVVYERLPGAIRLKISL